MKRLLLPLFLGIVALFVAALIAVVWLLQTEAGANWLWSTARNALPDKLSAASFDGSLSDGVTLRSLRYDDAALVANVELLRLSVDIDWFGSAINIDALHADNVSVEQRPVQEVAATERSLDETLAALQLPVTVRLRDLRVNNLQVRAADGSQLAAADLIGVDATLGEDVVIERIEVGAGSSRLKATTMLELAAPHALQLDARFTAGDEPPIDSLPAEINASLTGNFRQMRIAIDSQLPAASVRGTVTDVTDTARTDLRVTAAQLELPLAAADPAFTLRDLQLGITGSLDAYQAELQTLLSAPELAAPVTTTASLSGNLRSLSVSRLELDSEQLAATASGEMDWGGSLLASAKLDVQRLDPGQWLADWQSGQFLLGEARLAFGNSRLEMNDLRVAHNASGAMVRANGVIDTRDGIVDVALDWQDLQWPLAPAAANVESRAATLQVTGIPSDWTLAGEIALAAAELPPGRFVLQGSGSTEAFSLSIEDSEVLGGTVVGDVAVDLRGGGNWSAQLETRDTRITPFVPDWPGQVSAQFRADGRFRPFALGLDIAALQGQVRGRDISAAGRMQLTREQLQFTDLRARSGGTLLQLDGDWRDAGGVVFDFDSSSLADIVPAMTGSLQARGRLTDGGSWPQLQLDLTATDIGWGQWQAGSLVLSNQPAGEEQPLDLKLTARDVAMPGQAAVSAELALRGAPTRHELAATISQAERKLTLALHGALSEWQQPAQARWAAEVHRLVFSGRDNLELALRETTELSISRQAAALAASCIDTSRGGAVCGSGHVDGDGQYRARVELSELPLSLVRNVTGTGLQFTQLLTGVVDIATGPRGRPSGSGRIDMTPGLIRSDFDESLTMRTRAGFAAFELESGQLLAGEINLPFSDAAEIAGTFRVVDVSRGQDSPITGQLTAAIRDLGVGAQFLPQIDAAAGALNADIRVDGTLSAPEFAGGVSVHDGRLVYDPLGLAISDMQVDSEILAGNRIEIDSSFRAGEGAGRIRSSADYLQGLSAGFAVSLTGENLRLIDLPDLSVVVNPDLEVGVRGDDISINGKLEVPAARLASVKFVNTGVSESDDVVYVGDVRPQGAEPERPPSPLNYSGSVILELGDEVVIDLDVAAARLRGSSTYNWEGPALPRATGSFDVSGKFEAYGQLLEISEGTIRYPNVPANNPLLRIRAEREIFGNSQVRRAGVFVSGTALKPTLEVYTAPATTPDRALTLLVTGSDFSYEQGVGAVDVGTYIAPRLYASYGIGLFDRENVISVRYDLAKGFGIKATSGKRAAGIDISYTIER